MGSRRKKRNAKGRRARFAERVDIAEIATQGVAYHLRQEEVLTAGVLQDFASRAWADEEEVDDLALVRAGLDALERLRLVVGAGPTRAFVWDALVSTMHNSCEREENDVTNPGPRFRAALVLAAEAHDGQRRKGRRSPTSPMSLRSRRSSWSTAATRTRRSRRCSTTPSKTAAGGRCSNASATSSASAWR